MALFSGERQFRVLAQRESQVAKLLFEGELLWLTRELKHRICFELPGLPVSASA